MATPSATSKKPTGYLNSEERQEQPSTTPSGANEDAGTIEYHEALTGDLNSEEQPLATPFEKPTEYLNSEERQEQPSTTPSGANEDAGTTEYQEAPTGDLKSEEQPLATPSATSEGVGIIICQEIPTRDLKPEEKKGQPSTTASPANEDAGTIEYQEAPTGDLNSEERSKQPLTAPSAINEDSSVREAAINAISNEQQKYSNYNTTQRDAAPARDVYQDKQEDKNVSHGII